MLDTSSNPTFFPASSASFQVRISCKLKLAFYFGLQVSNFPALISLLTEEPITPPPSHLLPDRIFSLIAPTP